MRGRQGVELTRLRAVAGVERDALLKLADEEAAQMIEATKAEHAQKLEAAQAKQVRPALGAAPDRTPWLTVGACRPVRRAATAPPRRSSAGPRASRWPT